MTVTNDFNFTISPEAANRISLLQQEENLANPSLKISVTGGGCSGFQYEFDFVEDVSQDDIILEKDGVRVVIDEVAKDFLEGGVLEFEQDLASAAFAIKNPNASSKCGCGNSFSI